MRYLLNEVEKKFRFKLRYHTQQIIEGGNFHDWMQNSKFAGKFLR